MKIYLPASKALSLVLVIILIASSVNAQTKTAIASGVWSSAATWGEAPPTSVNDVVINNGVTVTVDVAAACKSVVINTGLTNAGITINTTRSLTVAAISGVGGGIQVNPALDNSATRTIGLVGTATLTAVSLTMADVAPTFSPTTLSVGVGSTATFSGDITMNGTGSENTIFVNPTGTLRIGAAISANGTLTGDMGSTIEYNGAAQTVRSASYHNLILSGSGIKTMPASVSMSGSHTLNNSVVVNSTSSYLITGSLFLNGTSSLTTTGGGFFQIETNMTLAANTTLSIGGTGFFIVDNATINGSLSFTDNSSFKIFSGDIHLNSGGVINSVVTEDYSIGGDLTVNGTGNIISGAGTWTFGAGDFGGTGSASFTNAVVSAPRSNFGNFTFGNLNINGAAAAASLNNNGTITVLTTLTGNGTFTQEAGELLNFGGASIGVTNFTATAANNIVNYNGAGPQTVRANEVYEFVTLSGSGAKTLVATVTINEGLSIQGTATTTGVTPTYSSAFLEYKGSAAQITNIEWGAAGHDDVRMDNLSGLTLNAAKTITGSFTFTNGVVNSTAANILIFNNGATSSLLATNETTTSYVNGPVRKFGNSAFVFPIGAATGFVPLAISNPGNAADAFTAQYLRGIPTDNIDILPATGINHLSACDYWHLEETADGGANSIISVTLYWNQNNPCNAPTPYVTDPASIRSVRYIGGSWSAVSAAAGTGTASDGSVVFAGIQYAALNVNVPMTLGSTLSTTNPLPVKFVDVKAYEKGTGVQIDWSNLTESELLKYVVERSVDGQVFTSIGEQLPRSNQANKESYSKFDMSPLAGTNFYRITAIEFGGMTIYSKILRVDMGSDIKSLIVYPNPTSDKQVSISLNALKGLYTLRIFNNAGQEVVAKQLNHAGGALTQTIELPASVKAGVYNLLISGDNYRQSKSFVVQ